jgi:hypothetical protein
MRSARGRHRPRVATVVVAAQTTHSARFTLLRWRIAGEDRAVRLVDGFLLPAMRAAERSPSRPRTTEAWPRRNSRDILSSQPCGGKAELACDCASVCCRTHPDNQPCIADSDPAPTLPPRNVCKAASSWARFLTMAEQLRYTTASKATHSGLTGQLANRWAMVRAA